MSFLMYVFCIRLDCSQYNNSVRSFNCWSGYDYYNNEYAVCYPEGALDAVDACNAQGGWYHFLTRNCWLQYATPQVCDSSAECTDGEGDRCENAYCYSNPNGTDA